MLKWVYCFNISMLKEKPVRKCYQLLLIFSLSLLLSSGFAGEDVITQTSTLDALVNGIYEGEITLNELKKHGNFGLGTFNALEGEMVFLDGRFYQIAATGIVQNPDIHTKTPFAMVTYFETDQQLKLKNCIDYQVFEKEVDNILPTLNIFYALKIEGIFHLVKTRSVPRQEKPYKPLTEIVQTQPVFYFEKVRGTMVGFRCPPYVKSITVPGYHLHFLTEDGKSGGHVLDFTVQDASLEIDYTSGFFLILPSTSSFYTIDLSLDRGADVKEVEKE